MNAQLPLDHAATSLGLERVDALRASGQFAAALGLILPQLKQGKVDPSTLDRAAMCFLDLGDGASALGLAEVMTQNWPQLPRAWLRLAVVKEAMGDQPGAIESYKVALRNGPNFAAALHALNKLAPFARNGAKAARLRKLCKSAKVPAGDKALLLNALGLIEQRAVCAPQAFRYFAKSNALLEGQFNGAAIEALVAAQEQVFAPAPPADVLQDGPRVIFVCGMPRSGTTLVESVLNRHPNVQSIGESKALKNVLKDIRQQVAASGHGTGYWDWFGKLSADEIAQYRQAYLAQALQGGAEGPQVIVDKMPLNCLDMGAAQMLFPGAKFVFLSRHPLDVALSNFATCFTDGIAFSQRLDWIGQLTRSVYNSLADYRAKLGAQVWMQSYEGLVRAPEAQIRALVQAVDLPWDAACLTPQRVGGPVRTASATQVREEINTRALGKWEPFAAELAPVVDVLGGQAWIDDWAERDRVLWDPDA